MHSARSPVEVLFAESKRIEAFTDFWQQRIEIEKAYLDNLSGLRIPDPPGNGQLQELAHKTRELLLDELEERRRGFAKLQAAHKALTDEFWTEEGPSYFDQWGRTMKRSLLPRMDALAADVTIAKAIAERLAAEAREKENIPISSSTKKENQPQSNVLSRFLNKARKEQPETHYHAPSFLGADSAYRQKVQKINDEKYVVQNETIPETVRYVEHDRKCIVALKHLVSTFSSMHSDLAQVLNVTSSQLCTVSSSLDASTESSSFAERLEESFTSLIQPCRYTSYDISSSLQPTTMLFGCPPPDDLDTASIGQRAVHKAFETILISAAEKHAGSLYQAICDACKQQGNDVKLAALQLESIWDPSQPDGGQGAVDYLARAPNDRLLVYFLTRLPEPLLPLRDADIKALVAINSNVLATAQLVRIGNSMGTARRCNLARLFLTLRHRGLLLAMSHPEGLQILTRTTDLLPHSLIATRLSRSMWYMHMVIGDSQKNFVWKASPITWTGPLILPDEFIEELEYADLLE